MVKLGSILILSLGVLAAGDSALEQARKLYNHTQFEESLKVLQDIREKDAAVYEWIGRNHYMRSDYKKATEALDKAFSLAPDNAEIALWLGRSYGRRAETSSPFTAPG